MSGSRGESNIRVKKVKFKIAGLKTSERRARANKAGLQLEGAFHNSHIALIRLVKFLDSRPFNEFINHVTDQFIKNESSGRGEWIQELRRQYFQELEVARNVREKTSNINEEYKRAMANWPPQQPGEERKLAE